MNKREWKSLFLIMKDLWADNKVIFVSLVTEAVMVAAKPYISIILTGKLVDAVYAGGSFEVILQYVLLALGALAMCAIISGICNKYFHQYLEYMQETQNGPMNKKGLGMDYEYLEDMNVHDMRERATCSGWSFGLIGSTLSGFSKITTGITSILIAMGIVLPMFFQMETEQYSWVNSWYVSALFFAVMAVLIWVSYKISIHYSGKYGDLMKERAPEENKRKYYMDVLANGESQKDLRIYQQEKLYNEESRILVANEKKIADKGTHFEIQKGNASKIVSVLLCFLVYAFAGVKASLGVITVGSVVTYTASILRVTEAVGTLAQRMGWLKRNTAFASDYLEFMSLEKRKYQGTIPMEKRRDNKFKVEFENVSFKYPGSDQYVIKDLNLSFVIGEKMAIVGKNGSGKTTFIKLLCRLYDVTEGCIKVNGIDIRKYDYEEYCRLFAVVFQDFKMFAFPLGENIAASDKVDEARAIDALKRAGLGERLESLEEGLDTYVGKEYDESGVNFSGGEKQKMAIARAIYKDAPFVIMDEPTAALDPQSECEVFEGFDKMVGKKTAIYISHRLASCRFCEDILVFDKGQVVQRGSHEELEQQDGLYRELWTAQAQYYQE